MARTVKCIKLGREAEALDFPPYPGALGKALALPEVRQRMIDTGSDIVGNSPDAADRHLRDEIAKWGVVVRAANVSAH